MINSIDGGKMLKTQYMTTDAVLVYQSKQFCYQHEHVHTSI